VVIAIAWTTSVHAIDSYPILGFALKMAREQLRNRPFSLAARRAICFYSIGGGIRLFSFINVSHASFVFWGYYPRLIYHIAARNAMRIVRLKTSQNKRIPHKNGQVALI
jgi:hypothetical protein